MEKEWFILIDGRKEGPYSIFDLKRDPRFTPDTSVWKKGFAQWVPAREVKELKKVFKDQIEEENEKEHEQELRLKGTQEILTAHLHPSYFIWWVIIIIIVLLYSIYRLYFFK
jgi:hypothetical protein